MKLLENGECMYVYINYIYIYIKCSKEHGEKTKSCTNTKTEAEKQTGLRAGRSSVHHLFCVTQVIEQKTTKTEYTFAVSEPTKSI